MLKMAYYRNKILKSKTLKGLVNPAIRQTGNPKSGQHLPQSLYSPQIPNPNATTQARIDAILQHNNTISQHYNTTSQHYNTTSQHYYAIRHH